MAEKIKSEGKCIYCKKVSSKAGISRHLETHLKTIDASPKSSAFHLRVEAGPFFLQLLMNSNAYMESLDHFLRQIWLECCGHMSQFSIGKRRSEREINQDIQAKQILQKGLQLSYVYDFGSSTELNIKVISEHSIAVKKGIELLSRNEPFKVSCHICKKNPAIEACTVHWYDEGGFMFCEDCSEKHAESCEDAADYALSPLVNSPRMGVCGYDGGTIDLDRDTLGIMK